MQNCKLGSYAQKFLLQVCDNIWVWSGDKHCLSKYQMVVVQNGYVRVGLVRLYGKPRVCCKDCGETIEIFATGLRFFCRLPTFMI